ncbi:MAG: hypothetical protein KA004_07590 [Verrucomicrobiales bacterium]|nr:hypothetical protein [Verrucomicrobiales bacterium]
MPLQNPVRSLLAIAILLASPVIRAQDSGGAPSMKDLMAKAQRAKMPPPSPLDKMLALDSMLREKRPNWKTQFEECQFDIDPDAFADTVVDVPLVLGVRIADGVLAIQAKDSEKLGQCADDIEVLARKLNVAEEKLNRAESARKAATKGEWLKVFSELSRLQDDVLKEIERDSNRDRGPILMSGGWLQGIRFAAKVVADEKNYSGPLSNFLREPRLVASLRENLAKLPAEIRDRPNVKEMDRLMETIGKIINVGLDDSKPDGWIPRDQVLELVKLTETFVGSLQKK